MMKFYGFDGTDVLRGELRAINVERVDLPFVSSICAGMDWEYHSRNFKDAQSALIGHMEEAGVDQEMVELIRSMKASFVPVDE